MPPAICELVEAHRERRYVFVWQIDALAAEHGMHLFRQLEAAGIDVVGEQEGDLPEDESSVEMYMAEVNRIPKLTSRRELELAEAIRGDLRGAEQARTALLEANFRMARSTRFSSYATWFVLSA